MGEIPDLEAKYYKYKESKINSYEPSGNYASTMGDICTRKLVLARTHWEDKKLHDATLQCIFDKGTDDETILLRDLTSAGVECMEQQRPFRDAKTNIRGRMDGKVIGDDGDRYPLEIKTSSQNIYNILSKYKRNEFMEAMFALGPKYPWMHKYPAQIQLYLFFNGLEWGIVLFENKGTGQIKQFNVKLDIDYVDELLKRAQKINQTIEAWDKFNKEGLRTDEEKQEYMNSYFPNRIEDREICEKCEFNHICLPAIDFGKPISIEDDPLFEKKLDRWYELDAGAKEFKRLNTEITEQCRKRENIIVGKYHITGKEDAKGNWRKKIVLVGEEKESTDN